MTDKLNLAIEDLQAWRRSVVTGSLHAPPITPTLDFLAAWDATREVREAEREVVKAADVARDHSPRCIRDAIDRLRELLKPSQRWTVKPDAFGWYAVCNEDGFRVATFYSRDWAKEWAAAREAQP